MLSILPAGSGLANPSTEVQIFKGIGVWTICEIGIIFLTAANIWLREKPASAARLLHHHPSWHMAALAYHHLHVQAGIPLHEQD